jgi:hypothetical protein
MIRQMQENRILIFDQNYSKKMNKDVLNEDMKCSPIRILNQLTPNEYNLRDIIK